MKPASRRPKLSVVMPVYNERGTIEEILERVIRVPIEKEIIVIDDGSTDGTREILQKLAEERTAAGHSDLDGAPARPAVRIFLEDANRGKGAALRRGFQEARGDLVVVQDADLEYDPEEYGRLVDPIDRGLADVVYGSRFVGGPHRVLLFWHSVANRVLTTFSNMFTDLNLSDVWTCYKMFRRDVLGQIRLREDRFGFEPEVTAEVARGRWRVYEVPISYHGRTYAEGKKITWRDAVWSIWVILRCRLSS
jgi:glycosyltransferase involved in cell wall biosynthesis